MDNLTPTLIGLALSRAGLSRFHPQAPLVLMLSANVPDIDIVTVAGGPLSYFDHHRGISHSIALAPVMALLPVLLVCAIYRNMRGWKAAWGLALIGVASHLLLDWTNAYGIRFFAPFSYEWFRLDLTNIVDLWIWLVLGIAWVAPALSKLVSSEMGATSGSGRAVAWFALSFVLIYDFGRGLAHSRAVETLESRIYHGGPPIRAAAFPISFANPFDWQGWVERPDFVEHFSMNLRTEFDPGSGTILYKPPPDAAIQAARQAPPVEKFLQFAQYPLWHVTPLPEPQGAQQVDVRDWRFPFTASATVDSLNRILSSSFHY